MQKNINRDANKKEVYMSIKINNRRYLGSKYKLIPFIKNIVEKDSRFVTNLYDPHRDMPYYLEYHQLTDFAHR